MPLPWNYNASKLSQSYSVCPTPMCTTPTSAMRTPAMCPARRSVGTRYADGFGTGRQQPAPRPSACTGGHGAEPYEQNTQQSPAFGRSIVPQPAHSWKNRHASVGIVNASSRPHAGQRSTEISCVVTRCYRAKRFM
jgi:hypothetical protein